MVSAVLPGLNCTPGFLFLSPMSACVRSKTKIPRFPCYVTKAETVSFDVLEVPEVVTRVQLEVTFSCASATCCYSIIPQNQACSQIFFPVCSTYHRHTRIYVRVYVRVCVCVNSTMHQFYHVSIKLYMTLLVSVRSVLLLRDPFVPLTCKFFAHTHTYTRRNKLFELHINLLDNTFGSFMCI